MSLSPDATAGKKKKTKLEKIAELEGKMKILMEENRRLNEQRQKETSVSSSEFGIESYSNSNSNVYNGNASSPSRAASDVEKLKDALKALKRVTIKQEMTLSNLRQKAKQRRQEIDQKDKIVKALQEENKAFRIAHEKIRVNNSNDISNCDNDISVLKGKIADLELQLAKEETSKEEQKRELKKSQDGISSLQMRLATIQGVGERRGVNRHTSSDSLSSASFMSEGTSGEDLTRLKKELAKKAEKIANLQYDLELAKDEIHDLKQQQNDFGGAFPVTTSPGSDDFFETDDDDDDFWGK
jgi:chromosome segregation ATPase